MGEVERKREVKENEAAEATRSWGNQWSELKHANQIEPNPKSGLKLGVRWVFLLS